MDLQLTGKVVVVTGAASGIGQATARLLTEEGAIVVGVDRDPIDTGRGARDTAVQADLTDPATPDRVIAIVLEQHGRIDALVNNAGGLQARTSFLDVTDEQWLATFNLNFHAARRMSRAAVPAMLASGGGSLVHLGSDSALRPPGRLGDQAAKVWGTDKETAITRMVTEIRPLLTRRMGQPDDIAQVVAYLVSPLSHQVTAAEWSVDGGAQRHI